MPARGRNRVVKRVVTVFSNQEYEKIKEWLAKRKSKGEKPDTIYGLLKAAVRDFIKKKS